jgi:hypothetical protein
MLPVTARAHNIVASVTTDGASQTRRPAAAAAAAATQRAEAGVRGATTYLQVSLRKLRWSGVARCRVIIRFAVRMCSGPDLTD